MEKRPFACVLEHDSHFDLVIYISLCLLWFFSSHRRRLYFADVALNTRKKYHSSHKMQRITSSDINLLLYIQLYVYICIYFQSNSYSSVSVLSRIFGPPRIFWCDHQFVYNNNNNNDKNIIRIIIMIIIIIMNIVSLSTIICLWINEYGKSYFSMPRKKFEK